MWRSILGATVGFLAVSAATQACAMDIYNAYPTPNIAVLYMSGPVVAGDFQKVSQYLDAAKALNRKVGVILNSPGGAVIEAEKIAFALHSYRATAFVYKGSVCASACFLMFAASPERFVAPEALVGVHSVSAEGAEDLSTMGMTTAYARDLAIFDVPDAIIGRLVTTAPDKIAWLTGSELSEMGVTFVTDSPTMQPRPPPSSVTSTQPATTPTSSEPQREPATLHTAPSSPAFQDGQRARQAMEAWFDSLQGQAREGAEFWAGQRSLRHPGSCYGPNNTSLGDWTAGCLAAQARFIMVDQRRKLEHDYKLGWNSVTPSSPGQPASTVKLDSAQRRLIADSIRRCYSENVMAPGYQTFVAEITVTFDDTGEARNAQLAAPDVARAAVEPDFHDFAERAIGAVLNPRCAKLPLPPAVLGGSSRRMVFRFHP